MLRTDGNYRQTSRQRDVEDEILFDKSYVHIVAMHTPYITDPCRFNLNEQKVAIAHFDPQSVLIPKM